MGGPPDTDEYVRAPNLRRQAGPFDDMGTLTLHLQANRIDWLLTALPPSTDGGLPSLGTMEATLPVLARSAANWLFGRSRTYVRLALAPLLFFPVSDRVEGYRSLMELVPSIKLDPTDDVRELFFQINRPMESPALKGIRINRVMKWSVGSFQTFALAATGPQAAKKEAFYQCQLDLDINTVPFDDPGSTLDSEEAAAIFVEFGRIAEAIAAKGERA